MGRAVTTLFTTLAILYFIVGGILAWQQVITVQAYALIGGIVGSLASSIGLVSLSRPSLQQSDLEKIESQSLKSIAENTEEIRKLEEQRASELHRLERAKVVTAEQIVQLKAQQEEMRLSVRKASLSLFLQEQRRQLQQRVLDLIDEQEDIRKNVLQLISVDEKLIALNEEIESDKNVDLLKSIIEEYTRQNAKPEISEFDRFISGLPPVVRSIVLALIELARAYRNFIRNILSIY